MSSLPPHVKGRLRAAFFLVLILLLFFTQPSVAPDIAGLGTPFLSRKKRGEASCAYGAPGRGPNAGGGTRCFVAASYAEVTFKSVGSSPGPAQNIILIGME